MYVKTAFLNGTIKEEIHMSIPESVYDNVGYVYKLLISMYGLKPSSRCCYETFNKFLKSIERSI